MKKKRLPIKPKRGYQWIGAVWIGSISIFLTVMFVVDGQFTLGAPDGKLITVEERPFTFWACVTFPITVSATMITFLIRGELHFRDQLEAYHSELEDRDQ